MTRHSLSWLVSLSMIMACPGRTFNVIQKESPRKICPSKPVGLSNGTCIGKMGAVCIQAPTCQHLQLVNEEFGYDSGDLCGSGFFLFPPDPVSFPMSISTSMANTRSCTGEPADNDLWHPFCWARDADGEVFIQRVHTVYASGSNPADIWDGALQTGCCEELEETAYQAARSVGFARGGDTNEHRLDPSVCATVTGHRCASAPTCEQIKTQWKGPEEEGGALCDNADLFLMPEADSSFPMAISVSTEHRQEGTNSYWHPFCINEAGGLDRLQSVTGTTAAEVWNASAVAGCCTAVPGGLPTAEFGAKKDNSVAVSGAAAQGQSRGCSSQAVSRLLISGSLGAALL